MTEIAPQLEAAHRKIAELERQLSQCRSSCDAASRSNYEALYEDNHITILLIDPVSGDILDANEAAAKYYGWTCEQLRGMSIFEVNTLTPDDILKEMRRAHLLQKRHFDFKHRLAGGEVREVEVYSGPLLYNGKNALYSCVFDVSERKKAQRAIRESENKFRLLFNTANDAIFVQPHQPGTFSEINHVACKWLGYSREELLLLAPRDILTPQSCLNWNQAVNELAGKGKTVFEAIFTSRAGAKIAAEVSSRSFRTRQGSQVISVARDVSNRKRVGRALFQAREAKADSRAKSKFLANISHELRTPVNGIFGMLQLLQDSRPLTERQDDYITQARISCRRLTDLLDNILDISSNEAGNLRCEKAPFSLKDSVHFVKELFLLSARQKQLHYHDQVDESIPDTLYGDRIRIEQILTNLVGNAIKFTENGLVEVKVHMLPSFTAGTAQVLITVADTGIGIPENMMAKVFKPFRQADSAFTRRYQGAGLGLSIVKQLLELMQGTACLVSEHGQGTKFYLSIPLSLSGDHPPAPKIPASYVNEVPLPGRVLVVEDDDISRMVLLGILENIGIEAQGAANGAEALKALQQPGFDLVLMDIQMPVMDGLAATRAIRGHPEYSLVSDIPIIGVTAHTGKAEKHQALDAGMNLCLAKPITVEGLKNALLQYAIKAKARSLMP